MTDYQQALRITVVSPDVALTRDVSWMLAAVGYSVQAANDDGENALWRRFSELDVLVMDGRAANPPYGTFLRYESENPVYRIFLYDAQRKEDLADWYAAGAQDGLRLPLSRGELIARVRAGARWLELERRLRQRSHESSIPGLLSRAGFLRKVAPFAAGDEADAATHTLLLASIDWYAGIRRKSGEDAARRLVASAARSLKRIAAEGATLASLGNGCFAALLARELLETSRPLAEQLARDFSTRESLADASTRSTLTVALVPWRGETPPVKLLQSGFEVLQIARQSGGDCIVEEADYADALAHWREEMSTGNPFANVEAQDIMEPFPAVLVGGTDQRAVIEALQRAAVPICPYIDEEGKLVGVAAPDKAGSSTDLSVGGELAAPPIGQPETVPHNASFPEIYEAFSSRNCSTLVVVEDDRPLGYLTCDGFLSLVEPVDKTTYARPLSENGDTRELLVPSLVPEPEVSAAGQTQV